jgi:methyltransferase (TIGR00027 family)
MPISQQSTSNIHHVSDTALWVAAYRAKETNRSDAIFHDPLAAILAGERGELIAKDMGYSPMMSWMMVVRTSAIDRLILNSIQDGIDTIVNLGAGLDTRPYRMDLPASLNWIEVDFPAMIEYKSNKLVGETAKCQLQHIALDLMLQSERRGVFSTINASAKNILVITEGVIPYLTEEEVVLLAKDIFSFPNFQYWIQDFYSYNIPSKFPKIWNQKMKSAPFQFSTKDWFGFFKPLGWNKHEVIMAADEAKRIGRPFPVSFPFNFLYRFLPKFSQEKMQKLSGYALLTRTNSKKLI